MNFDGKDFTPGENIISIDQVEVFPSANAPTATDLGFSGRLWNVRVTGGPTTGIPKTGLTFYVIVLATTTLGQKLIGICPLLIFDPHNP